MKEKKTGLSNFDLKNIALVLMVLDHIHYFFGFTGVIPVVFSWLGRLSAPLFLFCVVEGFIHTHNRKRYFLKLYGITIGMGIIQYIFITFGIHRPDGFYPQNQIFANFVILFIILQGIDWITKKHWIKGILAVVLPLAYPFLAFGALGLLPSFAPWVTILHYTFLPMHTAIMDGGTTYILLGIILYLLRKHKKGQAAAMFLWISIVYIGQILLFMPDIAFTQFFTMAYEWMGAFAGIILLFYNGQRGKGSKGFFYWFYPGHVYLLFAASWGFYLLIH